MSDKFIGSWNLVNSDNFDNYMSAVGVGFATRKAAALVKPTQIISLSDNQWTIQTKSTFKNSSLSFKLEEEFEEVTGDGRNVTSYVVIENGIMKQTQKGNGEGTITREILDEGKTMKMLLKCDSPETICTRTYSKQE